METLKPTLIELRYRITRDIQSMLLTYNVSNTVHEKLAIALAGLTYGVYCYIESISAQLMPQTATGEYLEKWFSLFKIERKTAAKSSGNLVVRSAITLILPKNTIFISSTGNNYQTLKKHVINLNTDEFIFLEALEVGNKYNLTLNSVLRCDAFPDLIAYTNEISGGALDENIDSQRARLIKRIRVAGNSGSAEYFEGLATTIIGIDRAWVEPVLVDCNIIEIYVASNNRSLPEVSGDVVNTVEKKLNILKPIGISKINVRNVAPSAVDITINSAEVVEDAERVALTQLISEYIYKNYSVNSLVTSRDIQFLLNAYEYSVTVLQDVKKGTIPFLRNVVWVKSSNV